MKARIPALCNTHKNTEKKTIYALTENMDFKEAETEFVMAEEKEGRLLLFSKKD